MTSATCLLLSQPDGDRSNNLASAYGFLRPSPVLGRMNPNVRSDFSRFGQLDRVRTGGFCRPLVPQDSHLSCRGTTVTQKHLFPMQARTPLMVLTILLAAGAQSPPSSPTLPPAATRENAPAAASASCAPTRVEPNQKGQGSTIEPRDSTPSQANEPLGDKLARSDGVLCPPPGVDPEIRVLTPDRGSMQVIPPPGSPGGDPTIRPK